MHRCIIQMCIPGHPKRGIYMCNLAGAVRTCYQQKAEEANLKEATSLYYCGIEVTGITPGHLDQARALNNFARALLTHFHLAGQRKDPVEAINTLRNEIKILAPNHPVHICLSMNLANSLLSQSQITDMKQDLEEVSLLNRQILNMLPPRAFRLQSVLIQPSKLFSHTFWS